MMLSKRLSSAVKYVKGFNYLADCGTDHGLFPIFAIEQKYVKKAIASDNKIGPIKNCIRNVIQYNLVDYITPKLSDGLLYLTEDIDVVSILGMGGIIMSEILGDANLVNVKRLVLSPNSEAKILRKWLMNNNFVIVAEEMVEEKGKFYQIIVCEHGQMILSDLQMEFGPLLLSNKDETLLNYVSKLLANLKDAYYNVRDNESQRDLEKRIKTLEAILK